MLTSSITRPEESRWCDLVMEGGVTSGIVYPPAVFELAQHYRFQSIGGASAGAIAAVLTAAAELRRRTHDGDLSGFDQLRRLPGELAKNVSGRTKLASLFIPEPSTEPLFAAARALQKLSSPDESAGTAVAELAAAFGRYVLAGLSVILVPAFLTGPWPWSTWVCIFVLATLAAAASAIFAAYRAATRELVENGYGLCKGYRKGAAATTNFGDEGEPLTLWLSRAINVFAGRGPDDAPVTFRELWEAPGFPPPWLAETLPPGAVTRSIRLEMMTTNLTHGRPYRFPLSDPDDRFFFFEEELAKYFPPNVIEHLVAHATRYEPSPGRPARAPDGLLQLPAMADLPIVFAARLSLSFPFLVSALPLWAVDLEPPRELRTFRRCWFSDGGISSNFPIHFFDSPLPLWPTFGIQLEPVLKHRDARLYMPAGNRGGRNDPWFRFDEGATTSARLFGFVAAIFGAARNWRDLTLARVPGVRDRVVRVRLSADEGGLNLHMRASTIERLAELGHEAGRQLVDRFVHRKVPPRGEHPMDWDNHRLMRLRTLVAVLEQGSPTLARGLRASPPGEKTWSELIANAADDVANGDIAPEALQKMQAVLSALDGAAGLLSQPPISAQDAPPRLPTARLVPDL